MSISKMGQHANKLPQFRYGAKKPRQRLGFFVSDHRSRRERIAVDMELLN